MKKSILVLTAIAAVLVLGVALMEFRERGFLSSYAAPPEKPAPLQTAGQPQTYNFDSDKTGDIPAGFHGARTGQGTEGKWVVMADSTAPSKPNVVAQTSRDRTDGLVFRLKDANNYYIVRANALEDNYRLYHVVNGSRRQFAGANFKVTSGEWHELKVECVGNKIICYYDGQKKIEATDDTFKDAGKMGLWTKADSLTYFDDLHVIAK